MILATPVDSAEPQSLAAAQGTCNAACGRMLHCSYAVSEDGTTAALAWTDAAGELAHGKVLECDGSGVSDGCRAAELCEDVLESTTRVRHTAGCCCCLLAG